MYYTYYFQAMVFEEEIENIFNVSGIKEEENNKGTFQ